MLSKPTVIGFARCLCSPAELRYVRIPIRNRRCACDRALDRHSYEVYLFTRKSRTGSHNRTFVEKSFTRRAVFYPTFTVQIESDLMSSQSHTIYTLRDHSSACRKKDRSHIEPIFQCTCRKLLSRVENSILYHMRRYERHWETTIAIKSEIGRIRRSTCAQSARRSEYESTRRHA